MTPVDLLAQIIAENTPESIWTGSPLEGYRSLGNTNRGEIAEGEAGTLVRMAEGQAVTTKITKKVSEMHPIEQLPDSVRRLARIARNST